MNRPVLSKTVWMLVVLVVGMVIAGSVALYQLLNQPSQYEPGSDECKELLSQPVGQTRGITIQEAQCLGQM